MTNPIQVPILSNSTEYIKKSDVLELIIRSIASPSELYPSRPIQYLVNEISSLPTINPVKVLEEIILKIKNEYKDPKSYTDE